MKVTRHTKVKRKKANSVTRFQILAMASKKRDHGHFSRFMIIIRPRTKISRCSIKLELKEPYKNVALFRFFSFYLYIKKKALRGKHTTCDISI